MLKTGTIIGERYEIVGKIGSGGMADVYKAKDRKLNRFVAIKVLKPEFRDDTTFISKFKTEAQSAARLTHPNIVNVFDVGDDNGIHFIVMELVEGITLKEYITKKGRLTIREATSIAIQVSMGLEAAHLHNIVHRDVKPQNIIISTDGKVKVTDFGIARAASSNTISSNVMGSVHYSSPEQVRGGYSDEKSDIYSLGITIYEMVTGRLPFDGETTVAIAIKHLQDEMEPPSSFVKDMPRSLEQIIYKCTQKSVDRRYNNMTEVIADLKRSLIEPNGNFVTLLPINNHAQTVTISRDDLSAIHDGRGGGGYDGNTQTIDERTYTKNQKQEQQEYSDYEDYEDDDAGGINSKLEKAMTIGGFIIGALIIIILIYFIGQAAGIFHFTDSNTGGDSTQAVDSTASTEDGKVKVPDLIGKTEDQAKTMTSELNIGVKFVGEEASADQEKGLIVFQSIDPGKKVDKYTTIEYKISSGPEVTETAAIPDVEGKTQEEAQKLLTDAGFTNVEVQTESNDTIPLGSVISISPDIGADTPLSDMVTLTVSKGPTGLSTSKVTVPNMRGQTEEYAKSTLTNLGLIVTTDTGYTASLNIGDIMAQSVAAGTEVDVGSTITITVNTEGAQNKDTTTSTDTTASTDTADTAGSWKCNVELKQPSNYEGGPVRMELVQTVDGQEQRTIIVDGATVEFPYKLNIAGAENVDTGTVYMYEMVNGSYVERASYDPVPFEAAAGNTD